MDERDIYDNLEARVQRLESDVTRMADRLGKVEDKASGAWKTINEVNQRMDRMETKVDNLERDVKDLKVSQGTINKSIKVLIGVVSALGIVVAGFLVYIWKHDAELAKSILSLGAMVGKIIA